MSVAANGQCCFEGWNPTIFFSNVTLDPYPLRDA